MVKQHVRLRGSSDILLHLIRLSDKLNNGFYNEAVAMANIQYKNNVAS